MTSTVCSSKDGTQPSWNPSEPSIKSSIKSSTKSSFKLFIKSSINSDQIQPIQPLLSNPSLELSTFPNPHPTSPSLPSLPLTALSQSKHHDERSNERGIESELLSSSYVPIPLTCLPPTSSSSFFKRSPPSPRYSSLSYFRFSKLLLSVTILSALVLLMCLDSYFRRSKDPEMCLMSYMRPEYIRMIDFDERKTKFGLKYTLYLYKDKGYSALMEVNIGIHLKIIITAHENSILSFVTTQ